MPFWMGAAALVAPEASSLTYRYPRSNGAWLTELSRVQLLIPHLWPPFAYILEGNRSLRGRTCGVGATVLDGDAAFNAPDTNAALLVVVSTA